MKWTLAAIECHSRSCNCENCYYKQFFVSDNEKCSMIEIVKNLLNTLGEPTLKDHKLANMPVEIQDQSGIIRNFKNSKNIILTLLKKYQGLNGRQLGEYLGVPQETMSAWLRKLEKEKLVLRVGSGNQVKFLTSGVLV